jgi:hypothetical protein
MELDSNRLQRKSKRGSVQNSAWSDSSDCDRAPFCRIARHSPVEDDPDVIPNEPLWFQLGGAVAHIEASRTRVRGINVMTAPGVRPNQADRRFVTFEMNRKVGTALSADWMRPSRYSQRIAVRQAKSIEP